jgi:hypothetical protein
MADAILPKGHGRLKAFGVKHNISNAKKQPGDVTFAGLFSIRFSHPHRGSPSVWLETPRAFRGGSNFLTFSRRDFSFR